MEHELLHLANNRLDVRDGIVGSELSELFS